MPVRNAAVRQRYRMEMTIDRAAVEAAAAAPARGNEDLFPTLLDRVVGQLVTSRAEPTSALAIAGQVVRGTAWATYRNGRARLASAAAAYLTWLAPPEPWLGFEVPPIAGRQPIGWRAASGEVLIDLLGGGHVYVKQLVRELARRDEATAIRAIDLLHPRASVAHAPGAQPVALPESPWWFAPEDER